MKFDYAMLTDLYQLTMAQGYYQHGMIDTEACFHMYFRDYPFKGGYAVACGMDQLGELVESYTYDDESIAYLRGLKNPSGTPLFDGEFLDYLSTLKLTLDIDAVVEGTIVFPNEPLVRVMGPILQGQLIETPLLNCVNFETLIATKAARVCSVAGAPVMEFGLRRAQGAAGGIWASRAAAVGGCASTSDILAGEIFDIPVSGTHGHSWVMSFPDELSAFRAYAQSFPDNCTLLVDTYDVEQGVKNAIIVGHEMRERGKQLRGIRIDSGDLTWLSKMARRMLDEAGLEDCGIVLSNDLDEYTIQSIRDEGVQVSGWGVGTKLACAYDQPTLGGVYKLSSTRKTADDPWCDHLKISESIQKLTTPGVLDIRRYYSEDGHLAGDMVYDENAGVNSEEIIVDPYDGLRRKKLQGKRYETLLQPLAREGKCVLREEQRNTLAAQNRAQAGLAQLDETQKRLLNPHTYPVGLEKSLFERRSRLVAQMRGFE